MKGHDITTGVLIPSDVNDSIITKGKFILFANRYSLEVSLTFDEWSDFKVTNFVDIICPNPYQSKGLLYLYVIIVGLIVLILLVVSFCVYQYIRNRSQSSEEHIDRQNKKVRIRRVPNTNTINKTNRKYKSEPKARSRTSVASSQGFDTSSVKSNKSYSKPIAKSSGVDTLTSVHTIREKPIDVKVNKIK